MDDVYRPIFSPSPDDVGEGDFLISPPGSDLKILLMVLIYLGLRVKYNMTGCL
jgi:hypothetical protein